jgi:hypothetical protein
MREDLEAVLRRVAAGDLSPEDALAQLDGTPVAPAAVPAGASTAASTTGAIAAGARGPAAETTTVPAERDDEPVSSVRVRTSYRSVEVIADPEVAQIHVTGQHWIDRDGATLVVTTPGPLHDEEQPGRGAAGRFSFSSLPRTIAWARAWRDHQLTLRINPALLLDLDVTGADVKLSGSVAGVRARLAASSVRAERVHCPVDLEAASSSVKLNAAPTGTSRIYCESSSVRLTLPASANLTISATNRMSRVALPGRPVSTLPFEGENNEVTLGDGQHRLTLEAVMSSVTVNTNSWDQVA